MRRAYIPIVLCLLFVCASAAFEVRIITQIGPLALNRWPSSSIPVPYVVDSKGSDDLSIDKVTNAVNQGFQSWQDVKNQSMSFVFGGTRTPANLSCSDRINSLLWIEQNWPHSSFVLAVTKTTSVLKDPPDIVDADIIFNGVNFKWDVNVQDERAGVLQVTQHEVGHFIGLQHSQIRGTTMFPSGAGAKPLSRDEKAGIQFLYPGSSTVKFRTISPFKGASLIDSTSPVFPAVTFRWSAPAGFSNFIVDFSSSKSFEPSSQVVSFSTGNTNSLVETPALRKKLKKFDERGGKVFWRVRADSFNGPQTTSISRFFIE